MPIDVNLRFKPSGKLLSLLSGFPSLAGRLPKESLKACTLDVYSPAVLVNVYGDENTITKEEKEFLSRFTKYKVFIPGELKMPRLTYATLAGNMHNVIGVWNIDFIRWLKFLSISTGEKLLLEYDHERGDTPYESAAWMFNYSKDATVVESLWVADIDGGRWEASINKLSDGKVVKDFIRNRSE